MLNLLLNKSNYELKKRYSNYNLETFLFNCRKNGLELKIIYDIGAYKGEWARYISQLLGGQFKIFMFEPNTAHNEYLLRTKFSFFNILLSDKVKKVNFYRKNLTGDSYFKELGKYYTDIDPIEITSTTLDLAAHDLKLPLPDLIKIDTQGSELDILKGGLRAMTNAKIIILEIPIVKYNSGAPNFDDYIDFLNRYDFLPAYLIEVHFIDKCIVQIDLAFMPKHLISDFV